MAAMGFRKLDDIIGRADLLKQRRSTHWKSAGVDLSPALALPPAPIRMPAAMCKSRSTIWTARLTAAGCRNVKTHCCAASR